MGTAAATITPLRYDRHTGDAGAAGHQAAAARPSASNQARPDTPWPDQPLHGPGRSGSALGAAPWADAARPDAQLNGQDLELLRLLADGALIGAVARRLRTSDRTVRRRIRNICDRLGVATPIQAVVWAAHRGLL